MILCVCSEGLGNTGTVACLAEIKNTKMLFVVPTFDNTGAKNKIAISTTMDAAWLTARLNDTVDKRFRPISDLENVTDVRSESVFETAASTRKALIKEGTRSFFAELWGAAVASAEYLGIIKKMHCTYMSVYLLDQNNNFIGSVPDTEDGFLYPIRVDKNSWEGKLIKATDTTQQKNAITFDFHPNENDEQLRYVTSEEYTCDFEGAVGLLDIYSEFVSSTTTELVVKLFTKFGTAKVKEPMKGLVSADFFDAVGGTASRLYNLTTSAQVTIVTVTESPDGTYTFTFVAQNVNDVIRITPVKNGYDFTSVRAAVDNIIA